MAEIVGIDQLAPLVGVWTMSASVDGRTTATGRSTFWWTDDGAFLRWLSEADPPAPGTPPEWVASSPFPVTALFGVDDTSGDVRMLYADARGVRRIYGSSLVDGVWRQWRDAPGFFQRFAATLAPGGRTLTGAWESSPDGERWAHDFAMTFTRVDEPG
jgi:hypothetical protein